MARDVLGAFGFGELAAEKNISALSGGEKTRIALMRTVLSGANLLLLDEPTNHLDIVCIESLERSLLEYTGTLMVVSHDRSFLYNVCDRYLLIEREPRILVDRNDLERYLESQSEPERDARSKRPEGAQKRRIRRSLNNEAKRFNQWLQELEDETVRMESERKELQRRMAESADSYEKAAELAIEEKELCRRIEENYENMVVAEEKLSEIEKKLGEL
ncbi:MAG: ATP-binding cassette domain-containing protein [Planctomycetota bacterium]|nr:ATP-binding cassette domain-containing protein [Planctomycetota bacterium]